MEYSTEGLESKVEELFQRVKQKGEDKKTEGLGAGGPLKEKKAKTF